MTMHRPATVDDPDQLSTLVQLIRHIADSYPIVFPVHPRTLQRLKQHGFWSEFSSLRGLYITEPLGYLEFLNVMMHAGAVVTDSGGVQEETTFLRMPCLTLRDTTERPTTVDYGTNVLFPLDVADVTNAVCDAMNGRWKSGSIPPLWDGRAAERIANILYEINEFRSR